MYKLFVFSRQVASGNRDAYYSVKQNNSLQRIFDSSDAYYSVKQNNSLQRIFDSRDASSKLMVCVMLIILIQTVEVPPDILDKMIQLFYMARPIYGGWVSFTAHLSLKYKLPLYKIGNKTETKERDFGYDVGYTNIAKSDISELKTKTKSKFLITAIDKNFYNALDSFPDGTIIVIHDPTEVKPNVAEPLLKHLKRFHVVTIRKSVQTYLKKTYNIKSKFILHPFFEYPFEKDKSPTKTVSISRIDFDKHTDILLEANKHLNKSSQIEIFGSINRQYVFFSLKNKGFTKYYKGQFEKSFQELSDILKNAKYVTDMSVIKNDGGGTQYTFLEAIYQECILVINSRWVDGFETPFINKKNCFVISNGEELAELLKSDPSSSKILKDAKKILQPHIDVNCPKEL